MELSYITRTEDENGNIQITSDLKAITGKPHVYFSCHPDDFERAFSEITEDILNIASCTIWYDPQSVQDPDLKELGDVLDQMQLVVFAISPVFLDEKNRAKDIELPYALQHHIPVLPIMLEPGLGGKFSKQCAKIQVVNRIVTDSTATPYEDVLRTYLNSVLIGDELAQKVRDAFDAYVFLSYRKKDRSHAQRLMHLIHENQEFRDIAIWYDEFLVPGEGFNEAIVDAFQKSSIFAMAVTPHLEEEGNYVMRVEYPLARDRKEKEEKASASVPFADL
ncbi:MAG: toll/interleukin-1 receptor domain-containing protein, partial [Lachnospiraceae bacterium]|nr:toll/interleukin-1 receptor domain-containing protein [Lachnospiraceae bacterium]